MDEAQNKSAGPSDGTKKQWIPPASSGKNAEPTWRAPPYFLYLRPTQPFGVLHPYRYASLVFLIPFFIGDEAVK